MSMESAKNFMAEISKGGVLQDKINAALESYTGDSSDKKARFEAVVIPIAKEAGFDISWEEIEGSADGELSADALKSFAGGWSWPWK